MYEKEGLEELGMGENIKVREEGRRGKRGREEEAEQGQKRKKTEGKANSPIAENSQFRNYCL